MKNHANGQVLIRLQDESVLRAYKIPNFKKYAITKSGKVYNREKGTLVHSYIGIDDYEHIVLRERGKRYRKRVHRLMGKVFLGNPQVVNHKNGIKSDNRLENLERSTHKANILHAKCVLHEVPTQHISLTVVDKNKKEYHCRSMREAERITGIDRHRIKTFLNKTHKNYTEWEFYK